ncbi:MAG: GntR family transcriptional regulator [Anaerolineales bacterium]|nr:GntR family transcriptional regulator [Anaerolineales bacterium]
MEEKYLYRQIAEHLHQQILSGEIKPGDRLPSVREMTRHWNCTIGTIQRAYQELVAQGLVTSRAGQGTRVVGQIPDQGNTPLRRLNILHRAEAFLLEVLNAGYTQAEIEEAVRLALDRWRAVSKRPSAPTPNIVRFIGSHDLAVTWLASHFPEIASGYSFQPQFTGSMGGLIALVEGNADLAGCHLWDEESHTYNIPFIQKLLPGKQMALLHLAERQLGLILSPGNPLRISGLKDICGDGVRFINRQSGSGTRVWLDSMLRQHGIQTEKICGYDIEMNTHSEIAKTIAEGNADVGLGLEASAHTYGLDFTPLTCEKYDLVCHANSLNNPAIQKLAKWLSTSESRQVFSNLAGYVTTDTGKVTIID